MTKNKYKNKYKKKLNKDSQCNICNTREKLKFTVHRQVICIPCLQTNNLSKCVQCKKIILNNKTEDKICNGCGRNKYIIISHKDALEYKSIGEAHLITLASYTRNGEKYYLQEDVNNIHYKTSFKQKYVYTEEDRWDDENMELDELGRVIKVNHYFARHGIAANEVDEMHQNCDSDTEAYVRGDRDYSNENLDGYIKDIVSDLRAEEQQELREKQLNKAFTRNNLCRDNASANVEHYIDGEFNELFKVKIHSFKELIHCEIKHNNKRLIRIKYIDTLFTDRHDISSKNSDAPHQLCCNFLEEMYINNGDKTLTHTTLKRYVDRAADRYKKQEKRRSELKHAFKKRKLVVRSDSVICDDYIEGGMSAVTDRISDIKCMGDIVNIADEMNFLFTHTKYENLVENQREIEMPRSPERGCNGWFHPDEYNDTWEDIHEFNERDMPGIRESNKPTAIRKFLVNGGDKKLVPKHLFKKYAKELLL